MKSTNQLGRISQSTRTRGYLQGRPSKPINGCSALSRSTPFDQRQPRGIGNLFRSSWESGDLGCSDARQGGLARESAAVAPRAGVLWLTNGLRPVPAAR
jgi:hypothetical protein